MVPASAPSTTITRASGAPGKPPVSRSSTIRAWTRTTGGGSLDGGVRSGMSARPMRRSKPPKSADGIPAQPGERNLWLVGHAAGPAASPAGTLGPLLQCPEVCLRDRIDRLAAEADEDARPSVGRLERSLVDDPRPARERLHPPAPLDRETRRGDHDPERGQRPGLDALDPDRGPQQAEVRLADPRRTGRRPRGVGGAGSQLGEQGGKLVRVVERRPDPAGRRPDVDAPLDVAGAGRSTRLGRSVGRPYQPPC